MSLTVTGLLWTIQYLHLAPSRWALHDGTPILCSRASGRSVTDLAPLCTEPGSSLMSLDTNLRTAERTKTEHYHNQDRPEADFEIVSIFAADYCKFTILQ